MASGSEASRSQLPAIVARTHFVRLVSEQLRIDAKELEEHSFDELGVDSLDMYSIDILLDDLGVLVPEDIFASFARVDDVYSAYLDQRVDLSVGRQER